MVKNNLLILVDGSSYLFRAYHAMPDLSNAAGMPTGAIYGVVNMIKKLVRQYRPEFLGIIFDAKGKNFRHEMYPAYKANRPPMPDDLREQINTLYQLVEALGMPLICVPGVEADDVIGTLANAASHSGLETLISSGDKDLTQLIDTQVRVVDTMKGLEYDDQEVKKKFGVNPTLMIDYLALVGDTSDNVPGVPKVGPKTASKWLEQYGSLSNIIANAGEIGGKVGENLRNHLDQLDLSRRLVTIKRDVELPLAPRELVPREPDKDSLRKYYQELQFKSWFDELDDAEADEPAAPSPGLALKTDLILDRAAFERWLQRINEAELVAVDTETTSIRAEEASLVGLSIAVDDAEGVYLPVAHSYQDVPDQLDRRWVLEKLRPWLEDPNRSKVGQNLKYDCSVLANYDISVRGIAHDTMLQSYVLNSVGSKHDLDTLAEKHLGHRMIKYQDVAGVGKSQVTFDKVPLDKAGPYAAEDAAIALRLHRHLWPKLQAEDSLRSVYEEVEMPLVPVLSRMECNGVRLDTGLLKSFSGQLGKRIDDLQHQAHKVAEQEFNLASPKQIQAILYDQLGLPVLRKTPKGQPSTNEAVLQELAREYELPRILLEHRALSKLKSTYTDKLPELVDRDSGRLHTSYHQAVAATGRLSSADPNLQNIPVRTADGRKIRQAFIPAKACKLLAVDYSQIELRIMAHLSGDERLLAAFSQGEDIHAATAADVFGVEEVSRDQRRHAKAINFGLIYGMSAFGLAQQLGIDRGQAQGYVDSYFERYPGVKNYMDDIRAKAHEQGYVETIFGRRLYLPEINSRNHNRRQYAERTAINAPMQGTAADLIKKAMIAVDAWIIRQQSPVKMIMQVHDELVLEVPEATIAETRAYVEDLMTSVAQLDVPLVVDSGIGDNWAEAH